MSRENVEIVRRAYEAVGQMAAPDVETAMRLYAPDHLLTTNWGTGETRTYRGLEGYRQAMEDAAEQWRDFSNEVEELVDAGDDVVVAIVRASGRGRTSGVPVERRTGALIRLNEGRIVSTEYHVSPEDAFAAAGLA